MSTTVGGLLTQAESIALQSSGIDPGMVGSDQSTWTERERAAWTAALEAAERGLAAPRFAGTGSYLQRESDDCLRCCVALLLGMLVDEVPHFARDSENSWYPHLRRWALNHGLALSHQDTPPPGLSIAVGPGPRGPFHAVVYLGEALVHDPHPSQAGLVEVAAYHVFRPAQAAADAAKTEHHRLMGILGPAMKSAAERFDLYATSHRAKGTPDGSQEAAVNEQAAKDLRAALAKAMGHG